MPARKLLFWWLCGCCGCVAVATMDLSLQQSRRMRGPAPALPFVHYLMHMGIVWMLVFLLLAPEEEMLMFLLDGDSYYKLLVLALTAVSTHSRMAISEAGPVQMVDWVGVFGCAAMVCKAMRLSVFVVHMIQQQLYRLKPKKLLLRRTFGHLVAMARDQVLFGSDVVMHTGKHRRRRKDPGRVNRLPQNESKQNF